MRFKLVVAAVIIGFLGLAVAASSDRPSNDNGGVSYITSHEAPYDFGKISMKDGNVTHTYDIKNSGQQPVTIKKVYTSCMCTETTLVHQEHTMGPFGMKGHGNVIPTVNITLDPGEKAKVLAEFDPAAHGSAGVGKIERSVYVDTADGAQAELKFVATVSP